MASRCGCGDKCACVIQSGAGVDVTGSGQANNPYVARFAGEDVVGVGLGWVGEQLVAKIAAGGGIGVDGAGALVSTVAPGGGGSGYGGPKIADLETRAENVVIGSRGAGYLIKPECQTRSFRFGQQLGLDAMHVPVRMLSTGQPVATYDETMAKYGEREQTAFWGAQHVQDTDGHRWDMMPSESGLWNPRASAQPNGTVDPLVTVSWNNAYPHANAPRYGWFGFREMPQMGGTYLADVFREVGAGIPLIVQLLFPSRDPATGAWLRTTPAWRTDAYLANVLALIRQFRLTESVVVVSDQTSIPTQAGGNVQVLDYFSSSGIRVGPVIGDAAGAAARPADGTWPGTWSWVLVSTTLPDATVLSYKNKVVAGAPLWTVLYHVNRQTTWANRVSGLGLLGGMSGDPLYAAGAALPLTHPVGGNRYRVEGAKWGQTTVTDGIVPPVDTPDNVHTHLRGYFKNGQTKMFMGPEMVSPATGSAYHVLNGWLWHQDPTNWSIDFTVGFDAFDTDKANAWLGFSFCRTVDTPFYNWATGVPAGDLNEQSGHMIVIRQTGAVGLYWYNGTGLVELATNTLPSAVAIGVGQRIRLGVKSTGIRARVLNASGATLKELWSVTTAPATTYRGKYCHFGRYSNTAAAWVGWFDACTLYPLGGTADGP